MADRIPSDHDTVDSHRLSASSVGRTGRLQILLPDACECGPGDVISLSLADRPYFAFVDTTLAGEATVTSAYANRRQAREQEDGRGDDDRLQTWLSEFDIAAGDTLVLDVLRPGYAYGLRQPGTRVVYEPPEEPDSALAEIADAVEHDR